MASDTTTKVLDRFYVAVNFFLFLLLDRLIRVHSDDAVGFRILRFEQCLLECEFLSVILARIEILI